MSNGLKVLAHVKDLPENTIKALAGTEPKVPGFPEYLDIEHPRHSFLTEEIAAGATEFVVADAQKHHASFETLTDALAARDGAKVTFGVEVVEVPKAPEPPQETDEEREAREAQERMNEEANRSLQS